MLFVKVFLDKSQMHGIGIFADQFIPKGTKVWEFTPGFDLILTKDAIEKLASVQQEWLAVYTYMSFDSAIILCCDSARHFNFSTSPNCIYRFGAEKYNSYASRDIIKGEELTYPVEEDLDAVRKLGKDAYDSLCNE